MRLILLGSFANLLSFTVKADEQGLLSDINIIEKLVTDSARIAKIENVINKLPKMQLFLNPRYVAGDNKENSFDIRRLQIDARGSIMKNLDYTIKVEFAGVPKILNANASWSPLNELRIRVGEYKIPFSLETAYSSELLEGPENSQIVDQLVFYKDPITKIESNGRDIGAGLYGGFFKKKGYSILDYDFGVFNGNGINVKDNNTKKNYVGRLNINPIKSVTISGSFLNGKYGAQDKEPIKNIERYAAGLRYDDGKFLVRSEYIISNTQVDNPPPDPNDPEKKMPIDKNTPVKYQQSYGWYALGGYYIIPQLQALFKYDFIRQDESDLLSETTKYYAGANYFFQKNKLSRIQLSYCNSHASSKRNINQVIAQLYIIF